MGNLYDATSRRDQKGTFDLYFGESKVSGWWSFEKGQRFRW